MPYQYEKDGAAIYRQSFATIRAEADLTRFTAEEERVAVRMIHASGLVELAPHIHFSPGFAIAARQALEAGAPILCDARMVSEGVTRARLPAENAVICTLGAPETPDIARAMGNTRSAAALELWRPYLAGAIVAIGNAPTALFHLLNMLEAPDCPRPAAIIGCPVGFVGAMESKAALWAAQPVPCAIVEGRLGGSAITVAAVNALARRITGTVHGVGLGPGAADLMSVRADRLVRGARHLAYFRKAGRSGHARRIVEGMLRADVVEFAMEYPVTTEIPVADPRYNEWLGAFYADCAGHLAALASGGEDVVVLCEGDPFFYGSFMHLHARLSGQVPVEVVPGITGMSGAWTATGAPITWGDDVLTVLMATLPEEELTLRIRNTDALVVMKIGRHLGKLRRAVAAAGREDAAWLIEHAAMPDQRLTRLTDAQAVAPYFSILVIHGQGRRP